MVVFKNLKTGKVEQLQASDVKQTKFMPRARGYCLKVLTTNGNIHKYEGFKESVSCHCTQRDNSVIRCFVLRAVLYLISILV